MGRFDGRIVAVVGAGSVGPGWGNGKAAAVLYAREGATVIAGDLHQSAANETKKIIDDEAGVCEAAYIDVTSEESVNAFFDVIQNAHGSIDVLHNNVGIAEISATEELSVDDWDRGIAINLRSAFLTCRRALSLMKERQSGVIINTSSIADRRWVGVPFAPYASAKAGLVQFTKMIAVEHAPNGIRANVITPGYMDTPTIIESYTDKVDGEVDKMREKRSAAVPLGHMGDAWDIANAAAFLASDDARYITGAELVVDGGLTCSIGFKI